MTFAIKKENGKLSPMGKPRAGELAGAPRESSKDASEADWHRLLAEEHADLKAERDALAAQLAQALAAISDADGLVPEHWWLRKHADIIQTAHDRARLAKHGR